MDQICPATGSAAHLPSSSQPHFSGAKHAVGAPGRERREVASYAWRGRRARAHVPALVPALDPGCSVSRGLEMLPLVFVTPYKSALSFQRLFGALG